MRAGIELEDMSNMMKSISEYNRLINYFTGIPTTPEHGETLKAFWENRIINLDTRTADYRRWVDINVSIVNQMWGNTSGGWEGMGGSAMTKSYTVIIENRNYGMACIYYGGKLAYICETDDKYDAFRENSFIHLPGHERCTERLTVICKTL
jgi:hypothetical protein